jgi:hypothetical protein
MIMIGYCNGNSHYFHKKFQFSWEFPSGPMGVPITPKLDHRKWSHGMRLIVRIAHYYLEQQLESTYKKLLELS